MSTPSDLSWIEEIVVGLFPYLARFRVRPQSEGGALEIKSAVGKTEIEGGGPAAARVGDQCTRLAFYPGVPGTTPPSLWKSDDGGATWGKVYETIITGPPPTTPGTPVVIVTGSTKVTIG